MYVSVFLIYSCSLFPFSTNTPCLVLSCGPAVQLAAFKGTVHLKFPRGLSQTCVIEQKLLSRPPLGLKQGGFQSGCVGNTSHISSQSLEAKHRPPSGRRSQHLPVGPLLPGRRHLGLVWLSKGPGSTDLRAVLQFLNSDSENSENSGSQ